MTTNNSQLPDAGQTALTYIEQQLVAVRRSLRLTRNIMITVVLLVVAYALSITVWLHYNVLQPAAAADVVTARLVDFVQQGGTALSDQVVQEVPATIATLPDMLLEQMPQYRVKLEDEFERTLRSYGQEVEPEAEVFVSHFFQENQDRVKLLLDAVQEPKLTKKFGDQLEQELVLYLRTPNNQRESTMDTLETGRQALENVEARLHRLAHANDLTPEELKLRRIIAATLKAADPKL